MFNTVLYEISEQVATITLNRPEVMNAFNLELHEEFYQALQLANQDPQVRSIIIKGAGKGFSAGADLSSIKTENGATLDYGDFLRQTYNRTMLYMNRLPKPIVSSIQGPAFGAGLGIALASDFRIASTTSSFSLAFIKIGLMPDAGVTYFLPRIIGLSKSIELATLAPTLQGEEAYRLGLINQVVEAELLEQETREFALRLAESPTKAFGLMKQAMSQSFENSLESMLEKEAQGQSILGKTKNHAEGVQAFFQKRKAHFTGE